MLEELDPHRGGLAARPSDEDQMDGIRVEVAGRTTPAAAAARQAGVAAMGAGAGLLGGAAMAAFMIVAAAVAGLDPLHALRVIGATFGGPEAGLAGAGTVAWGLALHAAVSIAFGLLFVAIFARDPSPLGGAALGGGYSLFVLGIMAAGVVPRVNDVFRIEMQPLGGTWVVAHALYGCVLGLAVARLRLGRAGAGSARNGGG